MIRLFGDMMDLPATWPMNILDLRQWQHHLGYPDLPAQKKGKHNALEDAKWNKEVFDYLLKMRTLGAEYKNPVK